MLKFDRNSQCENFALYTYDQVLQLESLMWLFKVGYRSVPTVQSGHYN